MVNYFWNTNWEKIRIPASLCPLHLWHEDMIKKLIKIVWTNLHIDLQWWDSTLDNMTKSNLNWRLDKEIKKVKDREIFLWLKWREELIKRISLLYWCDITFWNTSIKDINVNDFEWNVIWTDIFNQIIKKIEFNTNNIYRIYKLFSFKKLYLIERIWFPVYYNYEKILKDAWFNIEIIFLWKADFDISWTKIRAEYQKKWISWIKKFVSYEVFQILEKYIK